MGLLSWLSVSDVISWGEVKFNYTIARLSGWLLFSMGCTLVIKFVAAHADIRLLFR